MVNKAAGELATTCMLYANPMYRVIKDALALRRHRPQHSGPSVSRGQTVRGTPVTRWREPEMLKQTDYMDLGAGSARERQSRWTVSSTNCRQHGGTEPLDAESTERFLLASRSAGMARGVSMYSCRHTQRSSTSTACRRSTT